MNIKTIEITNVKGFNHKIFNLDILPNKPSILVAPNGYGKSSFAIAFDSLKSNKIELTEQNFHNKKEENRPLLSILLEDGTQLFANDTQNSISDFFDVFVINNQTEPKSKVQTFNGRSFAKSSLDIKPVVLVQTIPAKVEFEYKLTEIKSKFGTNGKVLSNISKLFSNSALFHLIESKIDFNKFTLKKHLSTISESLFQINALSGNGELIKNWIRTNQLDSFLELEEFSKLSEIISSFNFEEVSDDVDAYLSAWQLICVRESMGSNYKKACKYLFFLEDKKYYTQTIDFFNPVKDRFDIKPKVEGSSLIVKWPKAHEISNGQRDILTFTTLLLKASRNFKKQDCLLIIDEIFDYLDDANLITFQYFISSFIERTKKQSRRIYPILLTHLDPLFFNHFCFNKTKIQVRYLKESNLDTSPQILKLIYNRTNPSIQANIDAYFFHFHPYIGTIDLTSEFKALKLNVDWSTPTKFLAKIDKEIKKYIAGNESFDPLAVCFGIRIHIEKLVYNMIPDDINKMKFIEDFNGTKKKLNFAVGLSINLPETFFLLGIIYNTSLHLETGQDVSKPLGLKLENSTIRHMILNIFKVK